MKPFIDDPIQIRHFFCFEPKWARSWRFDEDTKRLKIETYANRVVEIDATSGDVTSVDDIRILDIEGTVVLRNGQTLQVSQIGICGEYGKSSNLELPQGMEEIRFYLSRPGTEFVRQEDGLTDVPAFTIQEVVESQELESGNVFSTINFTTVRMDYVSKMEFQKIRLSANVSANIELIDGTTLQWLIEPGDWKFCGYDVEKGILEYTPIQIEAIFILGSGAVA